MQSCFSRSHALRRSRAGVVTTILFSIALGVGMAVAAPIRDYYTRTWTTDDGLPYNSVSFVLQDSAGFMWFATAGGLARFDGHEFREMRPPAEFRAAGFNIRGLAEERPGVLVVVPAGNAVLRLKGSAWSVHPANGALSKLKDAPLDVHVDPVGDVWISTMGGRLLRWSQDDSYQLFGSGERIVSAPRTITFASDGSGGTWVAGDALWFAGAKGELQRVDWLGAEPRLIARGRNNRIWVWSNQQLLSFEQGKMVDKYEIRSETAWGAIRHLFEDREGALWISTSRNGVLRLTDGRAERVGLYPSASFVTEDREGNIWVGTDGSGVGQLREKSYRLFNTANGLAQQLVSSLSEDSTGRIWLANRSGGLVSVGADGVPQSLGLTGSRAFANVVCLDANDRLWFGGGRNGLLRCEPGTAIPERMPAPTANVHLLFRANNGDMWFAAEPGELGYYRGDTLRSFSGMDGFVREEIRAMAEDQHGVIWLGGRSGELLRWDGHAFQRFHFGEGFARAPIHAIHIDADGRLWIATTNGLVVKEGANFHVLTEHHGLADDIIHAVLEDHQGDMWFASRRGLFYAAKADLLAATRDGSHRVEAHRLGSNQGLVGITPIANYHPTARRTREGTLWFATAQGAVAIDPVRLPRDLPVPPVLIDEVRLDGEVIPRVGPLAIPSGQHTIEFRLAALSYAAPENVMLRHRLEGSDSHWIDTSVDRIASYSNLPPGSYQLKVTARSSAGRWNTDGASLGLTVVPAWWETLTFRIGVAAFIVFAVALLVRMVAHRRLQKRLRLLEQQHALQKERTRIARDLHDDLGASLTEVGLVADRLVETAPRELAAHLSGLAWRVRRVATDLSGIVWTMNAEHSSLADLAAFLRRYAERLFRNTGTRCIVSGADSIPGVPLLPDVQHQVLAATKEALNNVLKHARATEARVDLRYAAGVFEVRVSDDGVGFVTAADAIPEGNGLPNMRARMEEIGGGFELTSGPQSGTRVVLRVPIAAGRGA